MLQIVFVSAVRERVLSRVRRGLILLALVWLPANAGADTSHLNHLVGEKSRYLRGHAGNPVDWYPWGEVAFARARREQKPIFLSMGYASCHWCHVMERESFSSSTIAGVLNARFVSILVDREEHPDVDATYMAFVQAMTGSGGWPANLILTPDLEPIVGATYLKPNALGGLLDAISRRWEADRDGLLASSNQLVQMVRSLAEEPPDRDEALNWNVLDAAYAQIRSTFDSEHGGFGGAPKFPQPATIDFLLRYAQRTGHLGARDMALKTLRAMAEGGIHDQIGGGFHRYTVDAEWRVPHFEKMLHDQAQLAIVYTEAWQMTRDLFFAEVARSTLDYALRDLKQPGGSAFESSQDADSIVPGHGPELVEGVFYLWETDAVRRLLGSTTGDLIVYRYGLKNEGSIPAELDPSGDFKGKNILTVAHSDAMTRARFGLDEKQFNDVLTAAKQKMLFQRSKRPQPLRDDKIITSWNGLMISALARAGTALDEAGYRAGAERVARFIQTKLWNPKTRTLYRRYARGHAGINALAEDYAFLIQGLLDLFEANFDVRWLEWAIELQQRQDQLFGSSGGRYAIGGSVPSALGGVTTERDTPAPSPNSVSAMNLLRLGSMTDNEPWRSRAGAVIRAFSSRLQTSPAELPVLASALAVSLSTPKQIVIAGKAGADDTLQLLRVVYDRFLPNRVLFLLSGGPSQARLAQYLPIVEGMRPIRNKATAFVCERYVCKLPATDPEVLRKQLE